MNTNYPFEWKRAFDLALNSGDNHLLNEHITQVQNQVLMPMLLSKTQSKIDASDICSLTISKFWERFYVNEGELPENVGGYLYTMASNAYIHHSKMKNKKMKRYISKDIDDVNQSLKADESAHLSVIGEDPMQEKEKMYQLLEQSFSKLSEKCQNLLRMFIYEKQKIKDIYKKLGIASPNAATKKKESCINNLRKLMYNNVKMLKNHGYV